MSLTAKGTFQVNLTPESDDWNSHDPSLTRMLIDKKFAGDLEGTSIGQMLAYRTAVDGSAGYVAIEKVSGSIGERSGTFVLQHSSTMDRGAPTQSITVIPDSGTDELTGISGSMVIKIDEGKHFYELTYQVPELT